jgi:hypothetical protein
MIKLPRTQQSQSHKVTSSPPYTIVDDQAVDSLETEELVCYNIVLVVEGVPVENLLLAKLHVTLQTLYSGPQSSSIDVTGSKVNPGSRWVNRGSPIFGGHPWVPAEN